MRADCFKIVSQIAADLGGLHHLVNCVAYFGSESLGASEDDWDKTMKVRDAFFIRSFCPVSLISSCPGQCGWLKLHGAGSSGAHAGSLFGAELQRCQPQQYFCTSNSTKQASIVGVTQAHRPRGWAQPEPKLCARIEILVFVIFYQVDICSIQGRYQHPDKEHGLRLGKVQDQGELCIPWLDLVSWSCKGVQSQISRSAGALCSLLKMWHTWIVESRCHRLTILTIQGCRKWRS